MGEHARAHRVLRRQQGEDVVEDFLREVADAVRPARHDGSLSPVGRSVE
jgi:hypothetical protein